MPAQIGKALSDGLRHEPKQGLARLHETVLKMNLRGVSDPEAMYKVAQAYAVLGDNQAALQMLSRSTLGGFFCYDYIAADPLLSPLHNSPEFSRVLEKAKQRNEQFKRRFAPQK